MTGSALASWTPLTAMLVAFGLVLVALAVTNRHEPLFTRRIPAGLQRVTGVPGWAVATIGLALFGLLLAGQGFYSDVAWHVALGRDDQLFTAPHTAIFIGLQLIFLSGAAAVWFATATRVRTRWHVGALHVPYSALPLFALGGAAVAGFPLDELWHRAYGIDVTMWSPTHMLMILGASFTGLAAWLVLGEAGVAARGGGVWARVLHVLAAALVLQGLTAPLGEFAFGVPQFQQLFHPVLLCIAAGFALVAARLVLGRGWALGMAVASWVLFASGGGGSDGPVHTRQAGTYLVSALVVELVALVLGVERRLRFAVVSAVGVATFGLAGEWWWNQGAYQPWHASLLPSAVVLGVIGALGAAVAAVPFAAAVRSGPPGRAVPGWALVASLVAVVAVVVLPLPRRVGDVRASVHVSRHASSTAQADVDVTLSPVDAADHARWFQASSWQGGGLVVRDMVKVGPGRYRSDGPIPVSGRWKSLVRLHRGDELMTLPVYLPADAAIGAGSIPAVDRSGPLQAETRYLLRETHGGVAWLRWFVHALLAVAVVAWVAAFSLAVRGLQRSGLAVDLRARRPSDAVTAAPASPPVPTTASTARGDVASSSGPPTT
jgi:hypothetical protein